MNQDSLLPHSPENFRSDEVLRAWLDESLPQGQMATLELQLRDSPELRRRVARLLAAGDLGAHSVGAIWRRNRVSCPTREQWGMSLLGVLPREWQDYLDFHLQQAGCRYCEATLEDLRAADQASEPAVRRRRRYLASAAGQLKSSE